MLDIKASFIAGIDGCHILVTRGIGPTRVRIRTHPTGRRQRWEVLRSLYYPSGARRRDPLRHVVGQVPRYRPFYKSFDPASCGEFVTRAVMRAAGAGGLRSFLFVIVYAWYVSTVRS